MSNIQQNTKNCPQSQNALFGRSGLVQTKHTDRGKVQSIQHTCSGGEIIRFLGDVEVSRVEDHTENPAGKTEITPGEIVRSQRVTTRDGLTNPLHPLAVGYEIEQREKNREGLLDSHESMERPFTMVLDDRFDHWRIPCQPLGCNDMLTSIIAF